MALPSVALNTSRSSCDEIVDCLKKLLVFMEGLYLLREYKYF